MSDLVKELRQVHDWRARRAADRIEKLEEALREIIQKDALTGKTVFVGDFGKIASKALEN